MDAETSRLRSLKIAIVNGRGTLFLGSSQRHRLRLLDNHFWVHCTIAICMARKGHRRRLGSHQLDGKLCGVAVPHVIFVRGGKKRGGLLL